MPGSIDAWRADVPGIAGHRGARALAPENTLVSILKGLGAGATHIEVDVRGTADQVPVCIHDETAQRTCNEDTPIEELTLEDLKALDPCRLWSRYEGIATGDKQPPRGMTRAMFQIPTLAEVLETIPGVPLIVDLKDTAPPEATADVLDNGWRRPEDVAIAGYDDDVLDAVTERLPEAPRGAGYDGTQKFYMGEDVDADIVFTPTEHEGIDLLDQEAVNHAHELGMAFWVWTINEVETARDLIELGVDGIITDHPRKLSRERNRLLAP